MIEKTFESEARPTLTIRVLGAAVHGRTADMPADIWWILRWADLPVFLMNVGLSAQLRRGFEWALENRPEVEA